MALWLFRPVARADDPRWLDHTRFARLVVRADSAAGARQTAVESEAAEAPPGVGNETRGAVAGADDPKLYTVAPLPPEEAAGLTPDGAPAVLQAVVDRETPPRTTL